MQAFLAMSTAYPRQVSGALLQLSRHRCACYRFQFGSTAALGSPYVGTIDLEAYYHDSLLTRRLSNLSTSPMPSAVKESFDVPSFPGYAVPPKVRCSSSSSILI